MFVCFLCFLFVFFLRKNGRHEQQRSCLESKGTCKARSVDEGLAEHTRRCSIYNVWGRVAEELNDFIYPHPLFSSLCCNFFPLQKNKQLNVINFCRSCSRLYYRRHCCKQRNHPWIIITTKKLAPIELLSSQFGGHFRLKRSRLWNCRQLQNNLTFALLR